MPRLESGVELLRGRLTLTVPEAGRLLWGLSRDASYAAAAAGVIPHVKVGRRLVVPTHAALHAVGMSDYLIARALGLELESTEAGASTPATATIHTLAKEQDSGGQHELPPAS